MENISRNRMKSKKLDSLVNYLKNNSINGLVIPSNDAFQSEYVPKHARRLEWLTGFSGSNGVAVVLASGEAAFFTDGRYTIQAESEVAEGFECFNIADKKPWDWLAEHAKDEEIAFDPWLHTQTGLESYKKVDEFKLFPIEVNPIDVLWCDKPVPAAKIIEAHPTEFSGKAFKDKLEPLSSFLKQHSADYLLLTVPDSICWLLNIRGGDVPCTPLVLSYAFVSKEGKVFLFTESSLMDKSLQKMLGNAVTLYSIDALTMFVNDMKYNKIIVDKSSCPKWFLLHLDEQKVNHVTDPCQLSKAIKNEVEVSGAKHSHIRDGAALTKGLFWIEQQLSENKAISEVDVADKLIDFRKEQKHFKQPSFGTIAGFNANGAIVHYQPKKESAFQLNNQDGSMLLLDSGGQYLDGTTDITRTVALGKPTNEQKKMFTLVLKGHIALANAVFPVGTSGSALDVLARQFLWQQGLDYDHGTGHGVGSYLGVHEGPQRISKIPNNVALRPNMILSNEPGFYKAKQYGIRIESLVLVVEHPKLKGFLAFETLSRAPIDMKLVDVEMLKDNEKKWLDTYHRQVKNDLSPFLQKKENEWLENSTRIN